MDRDLGRLRRMRKRCIQAAEIHQASSELRPAMITPTYAPGNQWEANHLKECLRRVRQWLGRRGFRMRYVWVAELQQRGAVHYHVIVWLPESAQLADGSRGVPFWDAQSWWPHGSTNSGWATNAVGYIVKYATKIGTKDKLPCGARMHGSGGFTADERKAMSYGSRPSWLQVLTTALDRVRRAPGGGWMASFATGVTQWIQSPYIVLQTGRKVVLTRRDSRLGRYFAALSEARKQDAETYRNSVLA